MMGMTGVNYGMPSITQQTEPAGLQSLLQQQFNNPNITVANHATGGTSSSLMNELDGMDGNGAPFAQRIATSQAVIVIDNHAVNDALGGESLTNYQGYLAQWIQAVRDAGKTPVLEEPGPVCDGDHPQLGDYVRAMDAAAQQYNVPIIKNYQMIIGLPDWKSHMDASCFYPDVWLDSVKATQELAVIGPLVKHLISQRP